MILSAVVAIVHMSFLVAVWQASLSSPRYQAARPRIREQACEPAGFRFGHMPE
jgi:hypothetical protein